MEHFIIVRAKKEYIKEIAEIEKQCFSIPWSEKSLEDELSNKKFSMFCAVLKENGKVIGWSGMSSMFSEGEVANIAVLKDFRNLGAGFALTSALLDEAKRKNLTSLILEVRESNQSAKKIYNALGFKEIALRKNFYDFPKENGISMIAEL